MRRDALSALPSASLQGVALDGCGSVLGGNEQISFISELDALTDIFADSGELGGGFLDGGGRIQKPSATKLI